MDVVLKEFTLAIDEEEITDGQQSGKFIQDEVASGGQLFILDKRRNSCLKVDSKF